MVLVLAYLLALEMPRPSLAMAGGREWKNLYVRYRSGPIAQTNTYHLAWPADGSGGYRLTEHEERSFKRPEEKPPILASKDFKAGIEFWQLEGHNHSARSAAGAVNAGWLYLSGQGVENGRPVTVVWDTGFPGGDAELSVLCKVFCGDTSKLGSFTQWKDNVTFVTEGGQLVERALPEWLPSADRPHWAATGQWIQRSYTLNNSDLPTPGKWVKCRENFDWLLP